MTRTIGTFLALLALVLLAQRHAIAAEPTDPGSLFAAANAAYDQGAKSISSDRPAAMKSLLEAAADYRRLIAEAPLSERDRVTVHYNLGNALLLSGDTPRAILEYKRAQRLLPPVLASSTARRLRDNLAESRARAAAANASDGAAPTPATTRPGPSVVDRASGFLRVVPSTTRFGVFAAAFAACWLLAAGRLLLKSRTPPRWTIVSAALVALLSGSTLGFDAWYSATHREGVVIAANVMPRTGPDDITFNAAADKPVRPGAEFRLLEQHGGQGTTPAWVRVRLDDDPSPDSAGVWLPMSAVELVDPA